MHRRSFGRDFSFADDAAPAVRLGLHEGGEVGLRIADGLRPEPGELRAHMLSLVPEYMVPAAYVDVGATNETPVIATAASPLLSSPWNDTFWKNPKFNELLIAARSETDEAKRAAMYAEMQQILHDDGGQRGFSRSVGT